MKTLSEYLSTESDARTRAVVEAVLREEKGHVSYIAESLAELTDPKMKQRIAELHEECRVAEERVHVEQVGALQRHLEALQSRPEFRAAV